MNSKKIGKKNKYGLSRRIPDPIKREIRERSKFGCVVCRAGVVSYEHIDPEFHEAREHSADNICCLCNSCHDKVTRGHYSKTFIRKKYEEIYAAYPDTVSPPFDNLDFHDGTAELRIGGLVYGPGVSSVIRYHGEDVISVSPSRKGQPPGINAQFLDENGEKTLRIQDSCWIGAIDAWDTEVIGNRIKVRKKSGQFSLILRLEPPGKIIIEYLDMRFRDAHILASEKTYAVGRYGPNGEIFWIHVSVVNIKRPLPNASAIEFLTPLEVEWRDREWIKRNSFFQTGSGEKDPIGGTKTSSGIFFGEGCRFAIEHKSPSPAVVASGLGSGPIDLVAVSA